MIGSGIHIMEESIFFTGSLYINPTTGDTKYSAPRRLHRLPLPQECQQGRKKEKERHDFREPLTSQNTLSRDQHMIHEICQSFSRGWPAHNSLFASTHPRDHASPLGYNAKVVSFLIPYIFKFHVAPSYSGKRSRPSLQENAMLITFVVSNSSFEKLMALG